MAISVLIPAHNEQDDIEAAIKSVQNQTVKPDRIIAVLDNCTDQTKNIVESMEGVSIYETQNNKHKKAGALNQAWDLIKEPLGYGDYVFVMDADSEIDERFFEVALERLENNHNLAAVGGTFHGKDGGGFVGMCQRNEYSRYARDVRRRKGQILVLTGTATMFKATALKYVAGMRGATLPGERHKLYDTEVLTEDNELTLCLLHSEFDIISPKDCTLKTEVMETWSDLANQRLRWKRGALENLRQFGITKITFPYWLRQVVSLIGLLATVMYLGSLILTLIITGQLELQPIWIAVTLIFVLERMVTVRQRGWKMMLLAAPLVIEIVYDLFLQYVQARAFWQVAIGKSANW